MFLSRIFTWFLFKKHEQKKRTIKQKLGGKHVKKQQNLDNKKKDKRVKDKRDSSFEEDRKGCGQERFRSLLYSSFYSFVKQGQPHLLIH